jgi:uncharacterized protein
VTPVELQLEVGGGRLNATLVRANDDGAAARGLVVCHGFPAGAAPAQDASYAELAQGLASATGWTVLVLDFRVPKGGRVASLIDWIADADAAVEYLVADDKVNGVWVAGFSVGGALALCVAGRDERIRGVAAFAAPAEFDGWFDEPATVHPLQSISKVPPRPVLLVHGDNDDVVPVSDARALADAAGGEVELRIVNGGGHALRHDPRATAVFEGWLDRQPD